VTNSPGQLMGEAVQVVVSFCEHEWRPAGLHGFHYIVADAAIPRLVSDQVTIKRLKLNPFVRRSGHRRLKRCGADENRMRKRPLNRLCPRANAMPDGAALHEDDGMMPILSSDGCR